MRLNGIEVKMMKSYNELLTLKTFEERFNYLKCPGKIGDDTFGYDRWVNQKFYTSQQWRNFRNRIIVRDDGCDMALANYKIPDNELITVHHINPMTVKDIIDRNPMIFDENNVVCVRDSTHKAIHYGDLSSIGVVVGLNGDRSQDDMAPWKLLGKGENAMATKKSTKPKRFGIINTKLVLNVRSSPSITSNNVIDKLKDGEKVEILEMPNFDFFKIKYTGSDEKKHIGFVMTPFVHEVIDNGNSD